MLSRRQKNSIRGFTAALTCCALLSAFLIYTNISNTNETVPVVFSDILEGAVEYAGDDPADVPEVTLDSEELFETMFSEEMRSFTLDPSLEGIDLFAGREADTRATLILDPIGTTTPYTEDSGAGNYAPGMLTIDDPEFNGHAWEDLDTTTTTTTTTASVSSHSSGTLPTGFTAPDRTTGQQETSQSTTTTSYAHPATYVDPYSTRTGTTSRTTPETTTAYTTSETTTERTTERTIQTTTTTTAVTSATTARTTPKTTTTATARTTVKTTAHTSKTPFINVGGGVFYKENDVYLTLFKLVNEARRKAGLKELWYSARLHEVCELRTTEITSYYSHTRPDGSRFSTAFKDIGVNYYTCGENIAYGRNTFETPEKVFKAWMDSESHRENILSPNYECVAFGLSILKVGNDTYYYWSQEFAKLK